jgi:hypothetical protein
MGKDNFLQTGAGVFGFAIRTIRYPGPADTNGYPRCSFFSGRMAIAIASIV